jgi:endonuclease G
MAVRHFAKKVGDIYVITGPVFASTDVVFLNNRVAVPDHIFKLVYLPARHAAAAYYEVNSDGTEGQQYREISLEQLNIIVGMDLLPGVKNVGFLRLPPPSGEGVIGESN